MSQDPPSPLLVLEWSLCNNTFLVVKRFPMVSMRWPPDMCACNFAKHLPCHWKSSVTFAGPTGKWARACMKEALPGGPPHDDAPRGLACSICTTSGTP